MRIASDGATIRAAAAYAALSAVALVVAFPLVWAVLTSLKPLDEAYIFPPTMTGTRVEWSNYAAAFERLPCLRFMGNALIIATTAACGAVLTSSMAGYAFARLHWPGKRGWQIVLLASLVIPSQVLLIPHFLTFKYLGWVGTYKPLIVPAWLGGGAFNVLLFQQFFRNLPRELDDAARVDGASRWRTYVHVLLPAVRPAAVTAWTLSFVLHWQEVMRPLIYLSDFRRYPISLGLRMFQSMNSTWINELMAASLVALAPVAVVFFIAQRDIANVVSGRWRRGRL